MSKVHQGVAASFMLGLAAQSVAAPVGGVVESGSATITPGTTTTIQQNSNNVSINWQSYNVQSGEQVVYNQPSASSIALNRDFSGSPSQIFGSINANGQVFLLNTAGILIGNGASINTAGLMLSDLNASASDFTNYTTNGSMTLTGTHSGSGGISNAGTITTSARQGVTIIGQYINNTGSITANNGNINLTVASEPVVVTDSSGMIGVQMSQGITQDISPNGALLYNSGTIRTNEGNIAINIQYLSSLNVQAVNNAGIISAVGLTYHQITQNIVLQAPPIPADTTSATDNVVANSLDTDNTADVSDSTLNTDKPHKFGSSIDDLVPECSDPNSRDKECIKKRAIKNYLSRLLIGGSLPE